MGNYKKGVEMRQSIISGACRIFNNEGLHLTLEQLASKIDSTKSRITNYFPTKEHLFLAITQEYQAQFEKLVAQMRENQVPSIQSLTDRCSRYMDLQYDFRCAIVFAAHINSSQKEVHSQVTENYSRNLNGVRISIEGLCNAKLVKPELLEQEHFVVFSFQFVNLFTTWLISQELYYSTESYPSQKPIYLKGIINCLLPYLTRKGQEEMKVLKYN
jgi:AcrR family transcriptional regulator